MSTFVKTHEGWVNLAHVGSITEKGRVSLLYSSSGESLGTHVGMVEEIDHAEPTFIPAPQGYSVVQALIDDGEPSLVIEYPIIAFKISDYSVQPFTVHGDASDSAIKLPDGRVIRPGCEDYDNVEAFLADAIERAAKAKAARKEEHAA